MRQQDTRVVGQIAFAILVWSSLPVVSACDFCGDDGTSQQTMTNIGIIAACVALVIFLGICGIYLRRRQLRQRATRLPHTSYDRIKKQSLNSPKQFFPSAPSGYHVYHQATPAASSPLYIPQYPPRGYDPCHGNRQSQRLSSPNAYMIPERVTPVSPVSPVSLRAPSGITSRPISSIDTTPLSSRSSVRNDERTTALSPPPGSSPSPTSPRSPQRNVVESPHSPLSSSPPPRNRSVAISTPASPPSTRPSGANLPSLVVRPAVLAPMDTGTSNNNFDEAPPAYTPV